MCARIIYITLEGTSGTQPLYRNYLLQTIYEYSFKSAIRIDKNDPIFQHISMTYGGPWTVPSVSSESISVYYYVVRNINI